MRRMLLLCGALAALVASAPETSARTAVDKDCDNYCGEMAAKRCDDVSSTWCNAYIVGCLAGCAIASR